MFVKNKLNCENFYITLLGDNYENPLDFGVQPIDIKNLVKGTGINYCDLSTKSNLKESIENVLKEIYNSKCKREAMNAKDKEDCCNCTHRRCDIF